MGYNIKNFKYRNSRTYSRHYPPVYDIVDCSKAFYHCARIILPFQMPSNRTWSTNKCSETEDFQKFLKRHPNLVVENLISHGLIELLV